MNFKSFLQSTLIGLMILHFSYLNAQTFEWVKSPAGANGEFPRGIGLDGSGNVYTMGFYLGTVDFDPGAATYNLTSIGGTDIFICKLDPNGNFIWAKTLGGDSSETVYGMQVDPIGNVYLTGSFKDTADFDPNAGTTNLMSTNTDIFVMKLDASGNLVWAKNFDGIATSSGEGNSLARDSYGNIYTTGYFKDTVDFDPGAGIFKLSGGNGNDVFLSKLDSTGNFVWAKKMGGSAVDKGLSMAIDGSDNILITGIFQGVADFDPNGGTSNLTSNGQFDIFITKLDGSGNLVWAKGFGGSNSDYGNVLSVDALGNVYTTGQYFSTVDFDPGTGTYNLTAAGTWDVYVNKLSASGNFIWAKSMGGTLGDEGFGLHVHPTGDIYPVGKYRGTADFDPDTGVYNLTSLGDYDIYISRYDTAGNLIWIESFGDTLVDYAYSVIVDDAGSVYTCGTFDGSIDFDPGAGTANLTSVGQSDIFIQKLSDPSTNIETEGTNNLEFIQLYPNPASGSTTLVFSNPNNKEHDILVYNVLGEMVYDLNGITSSQEEIDIHGWSSGIYFFRVFQGSSLIGVKKLIKS